MLPLVLAVSIAITFVSCQPRARVAAPAQQPPVSAPEAGKNGYTRPECDYCPIPQYSDEAFRKKIQGDVMLDAVISPDGKAYDIRITKHLGYGLDEEALKTVRDKWRFKPALGPNGNPAAVRMLIEIDFHLYTRRRP